MTREYDIYTTVASRPQGFAGVLNLYFKTAIYLLDHADSSHDLCQQECSGIILLSANNNNPLTRAKG